MTISPPQPRPIETPYAGCRFRSRTEARWARFFDHLRIVWDYEPEGFHLRSGPYLPDFWLPDQGCWFEVKGEEPTVTDRAFTVAGQLAEATGHDLYLAWGYIPNHTIDKYFAAGAWDHDYEFNLSTGEFGRRRAIPYDQTLAEAYDVARGARFEHGEGG